MKNSVIRDRTYTDHFGSPPVASSLILLLLFSSSSVWYGHRHVATYGREGNATFFVTSVSFQGKQRSAQLGSSVGYER
ncbi:hypothetical protein BT69DRAFT_414136 [Atractiella rhizophila]|nr:hypothetical protein BT69DRAFT_414136 [Atractiella rhizophila]